MSAKLLAHAYGNMGEIATCGGFFTYNIIMSCYGFPFGIYFELLSKTAYAPFGDDYNQSLSGLGENYDPTANDLGYPTYLSGACNAIPGGITKVDNFPDWLSLNNNRLDLRAVYVQCCDADPTAYCSIFKDKWPA